MVAIRQGAGFGPSAPAGSKCDALGEGSYTFTVADKHLGWHLCAGQASTPYDFVDGGRVLDANEAKRLVTTLQAVAVYSGNGCGADKPNYSLKVTTPAGEREYLDSFYACNMQGTYVDGIDEVLAAASDLAH